MVYMHACILLFSFVFSCVLILLSLLLDVRSSRVWRKQLKLYSCFFVFFSFSHEILFWCEPHAGTFMNPSRSPPPNFLWKHCIIFPCEIFHSTHITLAYHITYYSLVLQYICGFFFSETTDILKASIIIPCTEKEMRQSHIRLIVIIFIIIINIVVPFGGWDFRIIFTMSKSKRTRKYIVKFIVCFLSYPVS